MSDLTIKDLRKWMPHHEDGEQWVVPTPADLVAVLPSLPETTHLRWCVEHESKEAMRYGAQFGRCVEGARSFINAEPCRIVDAYLVFGPLDETGGT